MKCEECIDVGAFAICKECVKEMRKKIEHLDPGRGDMDKLDKMLVRLKEQMALACDVSIRGESMAFRVEGDLIRIMNSAWLNLYEFVSDANNKELLGKTTDSN